MIEWTLVVILALVVGFVLLSPLESLTWWADKGEREVKKTFERLPATVTTAAPADAYLVYLSGVGTVGGDLSRREHAWLWRRLDRWRRGRFPLLLPLLIELRNVAQVLVSADPRYGPTFNVGLAQVIWWCLQRRGRAPDSDAPVILVGLSGGAQMALGAGWFLAGLGAPVRLISVGGIFGDDPGLDRIEHVWHLTGRRDKLHRIGTIAFPGRWPTAPLSPFGRAKREGRFTRHVIGDMAHAGADGYLGRRAFGSDGRSHAVATLDTVATIVRATLARDVEGPRELH